MYDIDIIMGLFRRLYEDLSQSLVNLKPTPEANFMTTLAWEQKYSGATCSVKMSELPATICNIARIL